MSMDIETGKELNWGPIGEDVYRRTYSRTTPTGNETWPDTVARVVRGSTSVGLVKDGEITRLTDLMTSFKLLPAGRHLWVTGTGLPYTRNCFRAPWSQRLADHFEFMADQLLTGGGVGANYSQEYIRQSPTILPFTLSITCDPEHPEYALVREAAGEFWQEKNLSLTAAWKIPDMREGWAHAWGRLFDAATGIVSLRGVWLDVSDIRPSGAEIKTFGGTASGPEPLVKSLVNVYGVLAKSIGRHMTCVEAMECDHHIASAVVAGGARRSARMSIVHWQDPDIFEFINCKTDHMLHWTTNISVEVDDDFTYAVEMGEAHAMNVLRAIAAGMIANGEPGLYNVSLSSVGEKGDVRSTNPCGEIALEEGESCNIGSVDLDAFGLDDDGAEEAFRLMTRFLIRATLVKPYQFLTAQVEERNRRIGVGFLGFQGWAAAHGVRYSEIANSDVLYEKLVRFRRAIREEADLYCDELGISRCVKVTAIAPNGTISQLRGTQPGIHSVIAKWFWRRVRFTFGDPRISEAMDRGLMVEPCIYADNTAVVRYPVKDAILESHPADVIEQVDEISLDAQFATLSFVTNTFCAGDDGNAVSFTANLDTNVYATADDLVPVLAQWLPDVKGLTVFPIQSRPQAPYEPITEEEWHSAFNGEELVGASNDGECAGGACPVR